MALDGVFSVTRPNSRLCGSLPLPELTAVLACHADRVLSFLGKTGIVDYPRFDRSVTLNRWQDRLTRLGQYLLVRPRRLADKMQRRLVLRCRPVRRRYRRHRLDALALARHY